jgi:hypothetical protein
MTRINAGIEPADLVDQHLTAEYREIIRIPNVLNKTSKDKIKSSLKKQPTEFKLGTGHVLFFYTRIKYLHDRFISLKAEMDHRGILNNIDDECFKNCKTIHPELYNDLFVTSIAKDIIGGRILNRIWQMNRLNKNKKQIDRIEYAAHLAARYAIKFQSRVEEFSTVTQYSL